MFYVSAVLIGNGRYTYEQMMQVFTLIIFSVTFAGQIVAYREQSSPFILCVA